MPHVLASANSPELRDPQTLSEKKRREVVHMHHVGESVPIHSGVYLNGHPLEVRNGNAFPDELGEDADREVTEASIGDPQWQHELARITLDLSLADQGSAVFPMEDEPAYVGMAYDPDRLIGVDEDDPGDSRIYHHHNAKDRR